MQHGEHGGEEDGKHPEGELQLQSKVMQLFSGQVTLGTRLGHRYEGHQWCSRGGLEHLLSPDQTHRKVIGSAGVWPVDKCACTFMVGNIVKQSVILHLQELGHVQHCCDPKPRLDMMGVFPRKLEVTIVPAAVDPTLDNHGGHIPHRPT